MESHVSPVAIVGGGPVGLVLALFLDHYGIKSVVFNSAATTRWAPKGSTHNPRTMEHYRRLGIARGMRLLGLPPTHPTDIAYFTRYSGWELARRPLESDAERLRMREESERTDQFVEPLLRTNQMYIERYLLEQARTRPNITLRLAGRLDRSPPPTGTLIWLRKARTASRSAGLLSTWSGATAARARCAGGWASVTRVRTRSIKRMRSTRGRCMPRI